MRFVQFLIVSVLTCFLLAACVNVPEESDAPSWLPLLKGGAAHTVLIYFQPGQVTLSSAAQAQLSTVAMWLKGHVKTALLIIGHTRRHGSINLNLNLAQMRGRQVASRLNALGVPLSRLTVVSLGDLIPQKVGDNPPIWRYTSAVTLIYYQVPS